MKRALMAYGVVLAVLLMVSRRFEAEGWTGVGVLDVAAGVVDALLVVAVVAGVLLAGRLGLDRWARSMARWRREQARAARGPIHEAEIIGVTSWRSEPRPAPAAFAPEVTAAPAPQTSPAGFTYVGPSYGHEAPPTPPFPERPGRRL